MPSGLIAVKQSRGLIARVIQVLRTRRLGHIRGLCAGLKAIPEYRDYRRRMPLALYKQWKSLPAD
jgi:hypothetical protein